MLEFGYSRTEVAKIVLRAHRAMSLMPSTTSFGAKVQLQLFEGLTSELAIQLIRIGHAIPIRKLIRKLTFAIVVSVLKTLFWQLVEAWFPFP